MADGTYTVIRETSDGQKNICLSSNDEALALKVRDEELARPGVVGCEIILWDAIRRRGHKIA